MNGWREFVAFCNADPVRWLRLAVLLLVPSLVLSVGVVMLLETL